MLPYVYSVEINWQHRRYYSPIFLLLLTDSVMVDIVPIEDQLNSFIHVIPIL